MGLYLQFNQDYHAQQQMRGPRQIILPVLKPGVDIVVNIPKHREYCEKTGIAFDQSITNQPQPGGPPMAPPQYPHLGGQPMAPLQYPPPYGPPQQYPPIGPYHPSQGVSAPWGVATPYDIRTALNAPPGQHYVVTTGPQCQQLHPDCTWNGRICGSVSCPLHSMLAENVSHIET